MVCAHASLTRMRWCSPDAGCPPPPPPRLLALQEKDADLVDIPNIGYDVFEAMMRFVYTGQLDVTPTIAFELLQASANARAVSWAVGSAHSNCPAAHGLWKVQACA